MHIVLVHVHVKETSVNDFIQVTLENARHSVQESGIVRFDVLQQVEDPTRFVLVEVYRQPEDQAKHRETTHYQKWRDTVADMMVEPRQGVRYLNLFPSDEEWQ